MIERPAPTPIPASTYRGAGVYVFRTRRPGVIGHIPIWVPIAACSLTWWALLLLGYPTWFALLALLLYPRHFAYVGETTAINLRKVQHLQGGGQYKHTAKPWSDLDPTFFYMKLPARKWLLRSVETMGIVLFWPVYNHQKNVWNPRRIPLQSAKRQRALRDRWGWSLNVRPAHLFLMIIIGFALGGAL